MEINFDKLWKMLLNATEVLSMNILFNIKRIESCVFIAF